jgi:KUP system potassium uptake protein
VVFGDIGTSPIYAFRETLRAAGAAGAATEGEAAAATAPVAPWVATLACRLADPFLLALVAVARWAAGLPGGVVTLDGRARVGPAVVVLLLVLAVAARRRWPSLVSSRQPAGQPPEDGPGTR